MFQESSREEAAGSSSQSQSDSATAAGASSATSESTGTLARTIINPMQGINSFYLHHSKQRNWLQRSHKAVILAKNSSSLHIVDKPTILKGQSSGASFINVMLAQKRHMPLSKQTLGFIRNKVDGRMCGSPGKL